MGEVRRILILGSTGSIGTQSIAVIEHLNALHDRGEHDTRYEVVGLAAGQRAGELCDQARRLGVDELALGDEHIECALTARRGAGAGEALVREVECDVVLSAMVGAAGLGATLAAAELGRDIALANKESLVAGGALVVAAARKSGARLLPVDSEHSALWQCLVRTNADGALDPAPPMDSPAGIEKVTLTASGGAFLRTPREQMERATAEQALAHPTWAMGAKITIDCATLANKAFEVIEAHWLFGLGAEQIGVAVHPQSVVHALVGYVDGSVIAQLGEPNMRVPIQLALTGGRRAHRAGGGLDLTAAGGLSFEEPDRARFPLLGLAQQVIERGGTSGAVFNAANEAAVRALLDGRIAFGRIAELVLGAVEAVGDGPAGSLGDVLAADAAARAFVSQKLGVPEAEIIS